MARRSRAGGGCVRTTNVRACRVPSGKRGGGQGGSGNALHVEADHKRRSVAKQLQPVAVWQPVHTTHLFVDLQQQVVDIALQPVVATVHLALDLQKRREEHRGWGQATSGCGQARAGARTVLTSRHCKGSPCAKHQPFAVS